MSNALRIILIVATTAWIFDWSTRVEAQESLSFFVEIEPARSTFFTGDQFDVHVYANRPELANFVDVEILAEERVVWSHRLIVAANSPVSLKGVQHWMASLHVSVDDQLPAGMYRARARQGDIVSEPSAAFTVEPWGAPHEGIQVALAAPAFVASGGTAVVALNLRNTSDRALHVPSDDGRGECATPWLTFVVFEGNAAASGYSLRDDRQSCGRQPTVLLQPGETTMQQVDLGRFNEPGHTPRRPYRPRPGSIRLHVSVQGGYYKADAGKPGMWKGEARSNTLSIEFR